MMLVLSPDDFQRLSVDSQQEILSLLATRPPSAPVADNHTTDIWNDDDLTSYGQTISPPATTFDEVSEEKRIVDITVEQAHALVANVGKRSLETLRRFALGEPMTLDELIGEHGSYKDRTDLKRSFVGAVNRRLRTVTGNRLGVLFGSDRDGNRIRMRPLTATALRQALDIQEPMPNVEFYDLSGKPLNESNADVVTLRTQLQTAWQEFSGRPCAGHSKVEPVVIIEHLIGHDFRTCLGVITGFEDKEGTIENFRFITPRVEPKQLLTQVLQNTSIQLDDKDGGGTAEIFLTIGETGDIMIRLINLY